MEATYTKLRKYRGTWGIKIVGASDVKVGQVINVTRRDGSAELETVKEIVCSYGDTVIVAKENVTRVVRTFGKPAPVRREEQIEAA